VRKRLVQFASTIRRVSRGAASPILMETAHVGEITSAGYSRKPAAAIAHGLCARDGRPTTRCSRRY
jgi:glycine cleavage system aminomethyltransferase T